MAQRKRHGRKFKAQVAIEAIKGAKSINEIASAHGVHPNQVSAWKKEALEGLPDVLADKRTKKGHGTDAHEAELYKQIGRLTMEVEFLKKKLGLFQ